MQLKLTLIRLLGLVLLTACSMLSVHAQKDTTRSKKYIVDKTKKKPHTPKTGDSTTAVIQATCYIGGPGFVTPGNIYEYRFSCNNEAYIDYWEVDCGSIVAGNYDFVQIRWDDNSCTEATISVWSEGIIAATKTIIIESPALLGGSINNPSQTIAYNTTPAQINTTLASGGNCSSNYNYQWQRSTDNINFTDISGATGPHYQSGTLTTTTYFRRKVTCSGVEAYTSNTATITVIRNVLNPGCITTREQIVRYNYVPAPIYATAASGGYCSGNYQYQWQHSTDNTYFSDIAGATSQNLTFNSSLPQTTYFQRKVTCGTEVSYTGMVRVVMTSSEIYYNVQKSGSFAKSNCINGGTGSSVTYTVAANTYYSTISQAEADQQAQNDINANGQNYANTNGTCTWYNDAISGNYYSQSCPSGQTPNPYYVNIAANTYSSTISKADANSKAQQYAQSQANQYGTCRSTCSSSTCNAIDKKCINGVCEQGVKVFTQNYYEEDTGYYVCTYHYEFSDGSWSESVTEYSYGYNPCY